MSALSLDELLAVFLKDRWLRPATQKTYASRLGIFKSYMGDDVLACEVTRDHVLEWREHSIGNVFERRISEITWNNYVRHLRAIYKHGIDHGYLPIMKNPFSGVSVSVYKKKKKVLTKGQIKLARECLMLSEKLEQVKAKPERIHPAWFWRVVFETFYHTGMRLRQLLYLTPGDVNVRDRYIVASSEGAKNRVEHTIPISTALEPHLKMLMNSARVMGFERGEQLFNVNRFSERHRSEKMNTWQVERFFDLLSEACGCRITPHRFRHTLGTELMREPDRNLHITKALLGHSSVKTTLEYVHTDVEMLRPHLENR
ncbi:tyrosine-type recombinase/integrase [Franzmannia qiaohouensis]|uniref:Tyrosine-type recombinase/integrase n=1 Tax=Franzmannia qiaohouensis TaxID=1329370 RepID=A0ABU1HJ72_9GAMM|nr:tyrosine-type recombinase/integrase [Halomonas qiaohouensis]MDR5907537.1 tyrosine-type recombinase/integrase [Halomonas qiaohouensis]